MQVDLCGHGLEAKEVAQAAQASTAQPFRLESEEQCGEGAAHGVTLTSHASWKRNLDEIYLFI